MEVHAAEVRRRCCHVYKDRLASANLVGKPRAFPLGQGDWRLVSVKESC